MKVKKLTKRALEEAADLLLEGGIVCFPTDTIYGLLAIATDKDAVERLFSIRRLNPLLAIPSSLEDYLPYLLGNTPYNLSSRPLCCQHSLLV